MKRWAEVSATLIMVAVLVLTACGPAATPTLAPTQAAEPTTAPVPTAALAGPIPAPEGSQVVDIVSQYGTGVLVQPWLEKVTAEYEAMFPNVDVQWTWGGAEYMQKVQARVAAADPPDAFWGYTTMAVPRAREGTILNVSRYFDTPSFEGTEPWKDTFQENVLEKVGWIEDGAGGPGVYVVPFEFHVMGIFYVDRILKDHGITIPENGWTWDEFLAAAKQLKDAGIEPIAQDAMDWYTGLWFPFIAGQVAGQQVLVDTATNKPGTSWVDNPDFLKAAKLEEELIKSGYIMEGYQGSQWPAGQMELTTGRCAMMINGAWLGSELKDNFPKDANLVVTFFPTIEGKGTGPVVEAKYNGWLIPKDAKHVDATIHFLKFLTSRPIQERKVAETQNAGILRGLPLPNLSLGQDYVLAHAKVVVPMYHNLEAEAPDWLATAFYPVYSRFFFGEIDAEQFIQELQKAHDAYWEAAQ